MYQISRHFNVAKLEDFFENKEYFFFCLELHSATTLFQYIDEHRELDERKIRDFALKIGQGLQNLHGLGIVLRNLSANGILMSDITKDSYSTLKPLICNLKKAHILAPGRKTGGVFGDVRYRAPETVKGQPYNQAADAWSYGVILYYMLTGVLPFMDERFQELGLDDDQSTPRDRGRHNQYENKQNQNKKIDKITQLREDQKQQMNQFKDVVEEKIINKEPNYDLILQSGRSKYSKNLVERLLNKDMDKRIDMQIALTHPWFAINIGSMNKSEGGIDDIEFDMLEKKLIGDSSNQKSTRSKNKKSSKKNLFMTIRTKSNAKNILTGDISKSQKNLTPLIKK